MRPRLTPADLRHVVRAVAAAEPVPPGYRLDLAGPDDLESILATAEQCFSYDTPSREELRYFLTRAHAAFFVFRRLSDDAIAGYTLLEANRRNCAFYNNTTCVLPECREMGLGRIFYALKKKALGLLGYKTMTAHVAVDNTRSLHLFQKAGFTIAERTENYYEDGRAAYRLRLESDA